MCKPVSVDIRSICESILVVLPNSTGEEDVEVMAVIAPDVPKYLFLDETYIHRILMNLLSNSLKFTNSGYIMLSIEMIGSHLIAKVTDTGSGIPLPFLYQIFEPFFQAQTQGSQRGTGLGLSIVKQLLHEMEGDISVESRHTDEDTSPTETGTTFTATIPRHAMSPTSSSQRLSLERGTVAVLCPLAPRVLEGLKMAWELFGCEVITVKDVAELSNLQIRYVWADSKLLEQHPDWQQQLRSQEQWTVLIPFDHQESQRQLYGLLSLPHFVPLQKPVIWHTIHSRIDIATRTASNLDSSRSMKVALQSHDQDRSIPSPADRGVSKNINILLVEDNPVCSTQAL